ncbi:MAG: cytidine deaminase [Bacteroidota bacterium]|nr:cytidine deaminase [Bacteroidota bacterium]
MKQEQLNIEFEVYDSAEQLNRQDAALLAEARAVTDTAYAPYSHFSVGAAALLNNGEMVKGTNQENSSYPVGICAERSLLASSAVLHPGVGIHTMAVSYHNHNEGTLSNKPISPCGMCRQALLEHELRYKQPIRLILGGQTGKIYIIKQANMLLPLAFSSSQMKENS